MSAPRDSTASIDSPAFDELRAAAGRFFSDPAARRNPAAFYGRLVREAPVLNLGPAWLVSGFDEVTWLSARDALRSLPSMGGRIMPTTLIPSLATWFALMLPMRDGADHRRLRGLASTAFSPGRIAQLNKLIEDSVDAVLRPAEARGQMDVVSDLAQQLPVTVSTAMLDVPDGDRRQVHEWAMMVQRQFLRYDQHTDEVAFIEAQLRDLVVFVRSLCDTRRRRPGEDLISALVSAADADQLSADELIAFILLLFVNGLEALSAGLTMGVWELLRHPEHRSVVAGDRAYAEAVFDEAIRLHSPVRFSARTLVDDVVLGDCRLRKGDVVTLCFGAANRDPRRYSDPDRFDPTRARRRHLGYGHGAHYCLGAPLSLATGACVLERLSRLGDRLTTHITSATLAWSPSLAFTTLESLPVRLAPSTTTRT